MNICEMSSHRVPHICWEEHKTPKLRAATTYHEETLERGEYRLLRVVEGKAFADAGARGQLTSTAMSAQRRPSRSAGHPQPGADFSVKSKGKRARSRTAEKAGKGTASPWLGNHKFLLTFAVLVVIDEEEAELRTISLRTTDLGTPYR